MDAANNFSVQQNLQEKAQSVQDPFGAARLQSQAPAPPQAMDNPFPPIMGGGMQPMPTAPVQTLSSYGNQKAPAFPDLAKQMGLDVTGLHSNPELAKLQLGQRLKSMHGDGFMQAPGVSQLLQAFQDHMGNAPGQDMRSQNMQDANTSRTLKALMGGSPT
jgi:hypothetical protein